MPRDPRFDILFEPVEIGPVTAPNRFYQVPHCTGMGYRRPQSLAALREVKESAEQAAQSAKYAPLGYRGMFGGRQSFGVSDYFHQANDQTMVIVLLEEVEALANLDEILTVPDIDVFFVAPSDLSQTMGHIGNAEHPEVQEAIDDALAKIVAAGRVSGTLVNDGNLETYAQKGVKFMMTSWNAWVARGAAEFIDKAAKARE